MGEFEGELRERLSSLRYGKAGPLFAASSDPTGGRRPYPAGSGLIIMTSFPAGRHTKKESIAKRMIKYLLFARSHEIWQREIL